jgi:hypothetical protein
VARSQEETIVAVTVKKAVAVAARAGVEAKAKARRPETNAQDEFFMDSTGLLSPDNRLCFL